MEMLTRDTPARKAVVCTGRGDPRGRVELSSAGWVRLGYMNRSQEILPGVEGLSGS